MAEKKSKKERFLEMVDELFDDEDSGEGGREETTIVLRGRDALRFLGIGDDGKPKDDDAADEGDGDKPNDDAPNRGKGYFKA